MTMTEFIESGATEAIITNIDIPEIKETLENIPFYTDRSDSGYWKYMYTYQPYAFYRHTKTRKWKVVQVTAIPTHVTNIIVNSWANAAAGGLRYAK